MRAAAADLGDETDLDADLDEERQAVERGSVRRKRWRGIASRNDNHALICLAVIVLNHLAGTP